MTLIELMITVAIFGILAAVASVSFNKRINEAISVEAVSMLGVVKNSVILYSGSTSSSLDLNTKTFGKPSGKKGGDDDGNNGHGDEVDGCDSSNPGKKKNCKSGVRMCG